MPVLKRLPCCCAQEPLYFSFKVIIVKSRYLRYNCRLNRGEGRWQVEMSAIGSAIELKKVKKTNTH